MFTPQARSAVEREARRVAGMLIEKFFAASRPSQAAAAAFTLVSWQPAAHSRREDEQIRYEHPTLPAEADMTMPTDAYMARDSRQATSSPR